MGIDLKEALVRAEQAAREKRFGEADGICRDILREVPGQPTALGIRGVLASADGDVQLAIKMLEAACAAEPQNPLWRSTLADVYRMVYRLDEALPLAREAASALPRQASYLVNLGKVLYDRGELDDAVVHFLAALAVDPENANAHLGLAQILLSRGEYRAGWIEYEWRNRLDQALGRYPDIKAPLWNGMHLPNGRIMLIADQGFGDTIQFARYIPMVAERCTEVVVGCAQDARALIGTVAGVGRTFNGWREIPGFTSYQLLSSLPFVFGSGADSIPADIPYVRTDPAKAASWQATVARAGPASRNIGLFWSGRPSHPNNLRRSMSLASLLPLAERPGIGWWCLQKELPPGDAALLQRWPAMTVVADRLTDFSETAALVEQLDLVITVDSAVAHLAGALGRPVWMLAATPSDWRWLLGRPDTAWYPTMRLFRQANPGDWAPVVRAVAAALAEL